MTIIDYSRYSQPAFETLGFAQKESIRLGYNEVDTGQLLVGIFRQRKSNIQGLLRSKGLNLNKIRREVNNINNRSGHNVKNDLTPTNKLPKSFGESIKNTGLILKSKLKTASLGVQKYVLKPGFLRNVRVRLQTEVLNGGLVNKIAFINFLLS